MEAFPNIQGGAGLKYNLVRHPVILMDMHLFKVMIGPFFH